MELQNNFTTPEQSRRLLELGLPVDSADCYVLRQTEISLFNEISRIMVFQNSDRKISEALRQLPDGLSAIPCWSVGRLIEIDTICYKWHGDEKENSQIYNVFEIKRNLLELVLRSFENNKDKYDFSKLED